MAAIAFYFTLAFLLPGAFGLSLFYFFSHLYIPDFAAFIIAAVPTYFLGSQAVRNGHEFQMNRAAKIDKRSPAQFLIQFSLPFFVSIAAAFVVDWLDWNYGFFIPSLSGMLAGTAVFIAAYIAIRIVYGPLRIVHIKGQRILTERDAMIEANAHGYEEGFQFGGLRIPAERANLHFLVVGATGSGKTLTIQLLLKDIADFLRKHSTAHAVIYDPKQNVLPWLKRHASDLPLTDFHPYRAEAMAWDMAKDVRSERDIETIANILFPDEKSSGENRFFLDAPRELTQAVLRCFLHANNRDWTFRDLYCILTSQDLMKAVLQQAPNEKAIFQEYFNGDERTLTNVRLSLRTRLLKYRTIAASVQSRSQKGQCISLHQWNQTTGGFLVLGSDKTPDSGIDALNRAILGILSRQWLEGRNSPHRPHHFLVLDEVQSAGQLSSLPSLLTEGREKGVSAILSFQDVASMRHVYGKDLSDALLSQFGNKALLRLEGDSTAQWASRTIGDVEQFEYTYGESQTYGSHGGRTYSTTEQRVRKAALMPSDFLTLPPTTATNGLSGYYASPEIGVWKHRYDAEDVFDRSSHRADEQVGTDDSLDTELLPLDAEDFARLNLNLALPDTSVDDKPSRRKTLGGVSKFDLNDD